MEGPFSVKEEDSSSSSSGCSGGGGGAGAGCFSGEQEETVCAGVLTVPPVYAYPAEEFKFSPTVAAAQPQINADISLPCSPHKRSGRRSMQKRVISIPVVETEGTRSKGGGDGAPPSDSWTWRKYGQKPIKGSPYPRGYYRCSSSKGCPARKRVERSRADPSMLVITYACEHNHPWPLPKNHNQTLQTLPSNSPVKSEQDSFILSPPDKPDHVFSELSLSMMPDEFNWFSDVSASPPAESFLCSPIAGPPAISPAISPADQESDFEEEEELFAGLGELPECSLVFRRGLFNRPIRVKVEGDDDRLLWHRRMRDNGMEIEREEERGYAAASR